jgi:leucyl aminopeptidase (aminopeptidase T)
VSERLRRLAEVLVGYSGGVRPGDLTVLQGSPNVEPLLEQLYAAVLRAGGQPVIRCTPELDDLLFSEGSDDQIEWLTPGEREEFTWGAISLMLTGPRPWIRRSVVLAILPMFCSATTSRCWRMRNGSISS